MVQTVDFIERKQREVSVFDGGPDTWRLATGLDLEVGP